MHRQIILGAAAVTGVLFFLSLTVFPPFSSHHSGELAWFVRFHEPGDHSGGWRFDPAFDPPSGGAGAAFPALVIHVLLLAAFIGAVMRSLVGPKTSQS